MNAMEHVTDAAVAASRGATTYAAGYGAWVAGLGTLGKVGLAVGVVSPPAAILVGAIAVGAATFGASKLRRFLLGGGR